MFALLLVNAAFVSSTASALDVLARVEQERLSLPRGRTAFTLEYAEAGLSRGLIEGVAEFDGPRYAVEIEEHPSFSAWSMQDKPRCVQVFDGQQLLGVTPSMDVSAYSVRDERDARFEMFHARYIGIAAWPLPGSDPGAWFWFVHGVDARVVSAAQGVVTMTVLKKHRDGRVIAAEFAVDTARGWNVVAWSERGDGYRIDVRSELACFDGVWFPCEVRMTQIGRGKPREAILRVSDARFNTEAGVQELSWIRINPPDGAAILNYRALGETMRWDASRGVAVPLARK